MIDSRRFEATTGVAKLVQDLRCALMERRGHDPYHTEFGSIIDGGIDIYGNQAQSMIGETDWELMALRVESEIRRICADYQSAQIDRVKRDRVKYGNSTVDNSELLESVTNIQIVQAQDRMLVTVSIRTAAGQTATLNVPVAENTGTL